MNKINNNQLLTDTNFLIRAATIIILMIWSYEVIKPFLVVFTGGAILAIGIYPLFERFTRKKKLVGLIALLLLLPFIAMLILPGWYLSLSVLDGVNLVVDRLQSGGVLIAPPGPETNAWPVFMTPLLDAWKTASHNLNDFYANYKEPLNQTGKWLLLTIGDMGIGMIQLLASLIFAWFILVYHKNFTVPANLLLIKVTQNQATHYKELIVLTIRNVMTGVLGVALLQTIMCGLAFYLLNLPFSGLWTMLCLILAISQIGMWPAFAVALIYSIVNLHGWVAIAFVIWMLITALTEQVIKPILLGRNSPVPMFILFIGSIGGLISMGITGLFLGPVIFTLVWQTMVDWLKTE